VKVVSRAKPLGEGDCRWDRRDYRWEDPRRPPELPDWDKLVKIQYVDIIGRRGDIIGAHIPLSKT
jgi:hypothetical protein